MIEGAEWVRLGEASEKSTVPQTNYGLVFDGADDRVQLPTLGFDPTKPATIEAWCVVKSHDDSHNHVIAMLDGYLVLESSPTVSNRMVGNLDDRDYLLATGDRAESVFDRRVHLAGVYNGVTMKIFVDGKPVGMRYTRMSGENGQWSHQPLTPPLPQPAHARVPKSALGFADIAMPSFQGELHAVRFSNVARYSSPFEPSVRFENDKKTLALYHFDEGQGDVLKDSSGNGHHGAIEGAEWVRVGATTKSEPVAANYALRMDGNSVELPKFKWGDQSKMTWECRVKLDRDAWSAILYHHFGTHRLVLDRVAHPKYPQWVTKIRSGKEDSLSATKVAELDSDHTYDLAVVVDGVALRLFIDGALVAEETASEMPVLSTSGITIGAESHPFHGIIDEIRFSNTARYQTSYKPVKRLEADEHTVALFHFDEGSGTTLKDASENGYDVELEGAEWVRLGEDQPIAGNHALSFDGEDDLVLLNTIDHPVTEPITYEATVYYDPPTGKPSQGQILVAPHGSIVVGPQERPLMLLWHALENRAVLSLADSSPLQAKQKYQFAACWDGATYRFFVDGQLVDQAPLKEFPSDKFQRWFAIGGHVSKSNAQGSLCFPGLIDEVRISNISRYDKNYKTLDRFESDEQTLALYHFDEAQGDVLKDSSQNGHDGKIVGARWVRVDDELNMVEGDLSAVESDSWANEREVAEWVIEQGGELRLGTKSGGFTQNLKTHDELPDEPFYVHTVQMPRDKQFNSEQLSRISELSALRTFASYGTHLNNSNISVLGRHPRLYMAHLQENPVTASLVSEAPLFASINSLSLADSQIDDAGEFMTKTRRLNHLILFGATEKTLQAFIDSGHLAASRLKSITFPYSIRPQDSLVKQMQAAKPGIRVLWTSNDAGKLVLGVDPVANAVGQLMEKGFRFEGNYLDGSPWSSDVVDPRTADKPISVEKFYFPDGFMMTTEISELMQPIEISAHLIAVEMKQTHLIVDELAEIKVGRFIFQGSDLDDAGLLKLAENGPVSSIDVRETRVTREGIARVKKRRPDLIIVSDWGEFGITAPRE